MVQPRTIVYRASSSDPLTILERGGFYPRREVGEEFSYDLTRHFEGEALDGEASAFVSTSYSIQSTILHAASLARPNSEMPFDDDFVYYIYMIRPADNFYDLEASLIHAVESLPNGSDWQDRCRRVLRDYGGMHELVALHGIRADRIMRYAVLTGEILNANGILDNSPLFTDEYWSERWRTERIQYNEAYNFNSSSTHVYPIASLPTGRLAVVSRSGSSEAVRLSSLFMTEMESNDNNDRNDSHEELRRRRKRSHSKWINWILGSNDNLELKVINY